VNELRDSKIGALIAETMARWHEIRRPGLSRITRSAAISNRKNDTLFSTLRKWLAGVPPSYAVEETQRKFAAHINVPSISNWIDQLEDIINDRYGDTPVVFCHNDLLHANIIYSKDGEFGDAKECVTFIDFEYAGYNYRGFDIANHFCEWAGFDCNYDLLISARVAQENWLRAYYEAYYSKQCSRAALDEMLEEVEYFALASHLYWGLWGLVQASFSDIPFDYMTYAVKRIQRFEVTAPFI
jgi:ethanolamine kinase